MNPVITRSDALAAGHSVLLRIAGIHVGLVCDRPVAGIGFDSAYRSFVADGEAQVSIECEFTDRPLVPPPASQCVFDSQCLWTLYKNADRFMVSLHTPDTSGGPYRTAQFDEDFRRGKIVSTVGGRAGQMGPLMPDPLEYPLGEVFTVSLLGRGLGLMVHACGLEIDGVGYLMTGHSGYGKSTLASMCADGVTVLNDDRIIVRMSDEGPRMYGTPWHGDHPEVDPRGVPIGGIFFIEHASENTLAKMSGALASAQLVSRSFPPLWSVEGMQYTLKLVEELVSAVPCFRMGFVPTGGILEFLKCAV